MESEASEAKKGQAPSSPPFVCPCLHLSLPQGHWPLKPAIPKAGQESSTGKGGLAQGVYLQRKKTKPPRGVRWVGDQNREQGHGELGVGGGGSSAQGEGSQQQLPISVDLQNAAKTLLGCSQALLGPLSLSCLTRLGAG